MYGVKRYTWMLGFVGFLGVKGFIDQPFYLLLFGMFGFFAHFWWYKIGSTLDERLLYNRNGAAQLVFPWFFGAMLGLSLGAYMLFPDPWNLCRALMTILSLGYAGASITWAYLTYRYDLKAG